MQILILWLNAWNKAVVIWLKSLVSKIFLICNSAHFFLSAVLWSLLLWLLLLP